MEFVKAHGAGNDFVVLPDLNDALELTAAQVRALCRPHLGIGADGVIRVGGGGAQADVFMDYRNADGSIAETCGNGIRCVAKYVLDRDLVTSDEVLVGTRAGVKTVRATRGQDGLVERVRVDMGAPVPLKVELTLNVEGVQMQVTTLSMSNPHAVLVVEDVASAPLAVLGPAMQRHEEFPEGTNVELVAADGRDRLRGRIWERGVGETLASGSGAAAIAVAAHLLGMADRFVTVTLPGGALEVDWAEETLFVTGPVVEVASGRLDDAWLASVRS